MGALYYIDTLSISEEEVEVKDFVTNGNWDRNKLIAYLSDEDIVDHICQEIKPPQEWTYKIRMVDGQQYR